MDEKRNSSNTNTGNQMTDHKCDNMFSPYRCILQKGHDGPHVGKSQSGARMAWADPSTYPPGTPWYTRYQTEVEALEDAFVTDYVAQIARVLTVDNEADREISRLLRSLEDSETLLPIEAGKPND